MSEMRIFNGVLSVEGSASTGGEYWWIDGDDENETGATTWFDRLAGKRVRITVEVLDNPQPTAERDEARALEKAAQQLYNETLLSKEVITAEQRGFELGRKASALLLGDLILGCRYAETRLVLRDACIRIRQLQLSATPPQQKQDERRCVLCKAPLTGRQRTYCLDYPNCNPPQQKQGEECSSTDSGSLQPVGKR